jgi:glycosyltransferase involved in cell wall biosynthesis
MKIAESRLLLVLPIVPWPIRRNGISLRFGPIIDYLSRRYELDLLVLAERPEPGEREGPLQRCRAVTIIPVPVVALTPLVRRLKVAWSGLVPWGLPLGSTRNIARRELERKVAQFLERERYSTVIWGAGHLDTACRLRRQHPQVRFVSDVVDSPALASARARSIRADLRFLSRYTAWKWRRLERRVEAVFDAVIYISEVDARAARSRHTPRVHVVPNGLTYADAPLRLRREPPTNRIIGFLGDMSYSPNVSAVLRLARQIFPRVVDAVGDARLLIIGRNPVPEIRSLQSAAITVTGTVDDIWPYISQANVFVFPMIEGAGLQNKILEVMYAEVPVVTTWMAAAGVGAVDAGQLLVGDTDDDIAKKTVRLLCDRAYAGQLAERARQFVMREFDWKKILPRYEAIVAVPARGDHTDTLSSRSSSAERSG